MKRRIPHLLGALCVLASLCSPAKAYDGDLPRFGANLNEVTYYMESVPFMDMSRINKQWTGVNASIGDWDNKSLLLDLDSDGWPLSLPAGYTLNLDLWLADNPFLAGTNRIWPEGNYRLTWNGTGTISVSGLTLVSDLGNNTRIYSRTTQTGSLRITISATNSQDHIRDIHLDLPGYETATSRFHPDFLADVSRFGVLRFHDWMRTASGSPISEWNQRTHVTSAFWGSEYGVPYEVLIELCNEADADLYLVIPHLASDDYMTKMAQLVRYGSDGINPYTSPQANPVFPPLDPEHKVYFEYGNEAWSDGGPGEPTHDYCQDVLAPLYGVTKTAHAYALRSKEMWSIFENVFGGTDRLVRVLGGWSYQSSWASTAFEMLDGEADALAIAPYIGGDLVSGGGSLPQYIVDNGYFDVPFQDIFDEISAIVETTMRTKVASNRAIAAANGASLITYEGGPGVVGASIPLQNDNQLTDYLTELHRQPQWEGIYHDYIDMLTEENVKTYIAYEYCRGSGKWGYFGHKEYQWQPLGDANTYGSAHKLRALFDIIDNPPPFPEPIVITDAFIIDNDDARAQNNGFWNQTFGNSLFQGANWHGRGASATGTATFSYFPTVSGFFEIRVLAVGAHLTHNQPWTVSTPTGDETIIVDMAAKENTWVSLGVHQLDETSFVQTTNGYTPEAAGSSSWACADAVQFIPVALPTGPSAQATILDNVSPVFTSSGFWGGQTWSGFYGANWAARPAAIGTASEARWTPALTGNEGYYDIYVRVSGSHRTSNQPFTVSAEGTIDTFPVDMETPTDGDWIYLATAYLQQGDYISTTANYAPVSNGTSKWAVADAIAIDPLDSGGVPTLVTLAAVADRSNEGPDTSGTASTEMVSQWSRYAVKFNLPATAPAQAVLSLYRGPSTRSAAFSVYEIGDAWDESTDPANSSTLIASVPAAEGSVWLEFDVTSYVQAQVGSDQVASFLVKTDNGNWVSVHARENAVNPPELILSGTAP